MLKREPPDKGGLLLVGVRAVEDPSGSVSEVVAPSCRAVSSVAGLEVEAAEGSSTGISGSGASLPASWTLGPVSGVLRSSLLVSIPQNALQLPEQSLQCEVAGHGSSPDRKVGSLVIRAAFRQLLGKAVWEGGLPAKYFELTSVPSAIVILPGPEQPQLRNCTQGSNIRQVCERKETCERGRSPVQHFKVLKANPAGGNEQPSVILGCCEGISDGSAICTMKEPVRSLL